LDIKEQINYEFKKLKFTPRQIQVETIEKIVETFKTKNHFIGQLPTGTGKSLIAYVTGKIMETQDLSSVILTHTKFLQEQYIKDFKDDLKSLKGAKNYECTFKQQLNDNKMGLDKIKEDLKDQLKEVSFEDSNQNEKKIYYGDEECNKLKHIKINGVTCQSNCPYLIAKKEFLKSSIKLTNMSMGSKISSFNEADEVKNSEGITVKKFNNRSLIIIDEAHRIEDVLIDTGTFVFNPIIYTDLHREITSENIFSENDMGELYNVINMYFQNLIQYNNKVIKLKPETNLIQKVEWFNKQLLFRDVDPEIKISKKEIEFRNYINSIYSHLGIAKTNTEIVILITKDEDSKTSVIAKLQGKENFIFTLKPISPKGCVNKLLYNKGQKYLHLSATIGDIDYYLEEMNIPETDYEFLDLPSPFPKENRKIVFAPVIDYNYRNKEQAIPMISKAMNTIINTYHPNDLGVIHTSSYSDAWEFRPLLGITQRIFIPKIHEIKEHIGKKVLIGPSLFEGVDFKDDKARWQIITKMPYSSIGDTYTQIKMNYNKKWYFNVTLKKIIQAIGRVVRHEEDYGVTYILDGNFKNFIPYLPEYIKESLKILKK